MLKIQEVGWGCSHPLTGPDEMNDPIVDEVRSVRDLQAAGLENESYAIFLELKRWKKERGFSLRVSLCPTKR